MIGCFRVSCLHFKRFLCIQYGRMKCECNLQANKQIKSALPASSVWLNLQSRVRDCDLLVIRSSTSAALHDIMRSQVLIAEAGSHRNLSGYLRLCGRDIRNNIETDNVKSARARSCYDLRSIIKAMMSPDVAGDWAARCCGGWVL